MPTSKRRLAWAAVIVALCAAASVTLTPGVVGLFHDDGIYLVTAKSLAEDGSYRLANLPGAPHETKYPPFYPLLLSLVWRVAPSFPDNVIPLKGLNILFLAGLLAAVITLARRVMQAPPWWITLGVVLAVGASPGIVSFADFTLSDVLFVTETTWVLALLSGDVETDATRRNLIASALVAGAILTRVVGVCLAAAVVMDHLRRRNLAWAALHALSAAVVCAAWVQWAHLHQQGTAASLLAYYFGYEKTALGYLVTSPVLARDILVANAGMALQSAPINLGPGVLLWPLSVGLAITGLWMAVRLGLWLPLLFSLFYGAAILAYPFAPGRYALPLVPLFVLFAALPAATGRRGPDAGLPGHLRQLAVGLFLLVLTAGDIAWYRFRLDPAQRNLRGAYGIDLLVPWSGFAETFEWLSVHTGPGDRLAGPYDPMYYLYARRQALRPWFHHPETYFYPRTGPHPFVGTGTEVLDDLRANAVTHVLIQPMAGFAEGRAATALLREILARPESQAVLRFRSADGRHEVYSVQLER